MQTIGTLNKNCCLQPKTPISFQKKVFDCDGFVEIVCRLNLYCLLFAKERKQELALIEKVFYQHFDARGRDRCCLACQGMQGGTALQKAT